MDTILSEEDRISNTQPESVEEQTVHKYLKGILDATAPEFYPGFAYTSRVGSPIHIEPQVPETDPNLQHGDQNSKNLVDCAYRPISPKPQGSWKNNDFPPSVIGETYNYMACIFRGLNQLRSATTRSEEKKVLQKKHGESSDTLKEDRNSREYPHSPPVKHKGALCFFLKDDTLINVSLEGAIRLHNFKNNIVLALCGTGNSCGLIHPSGRVYQYSSRVDVVVHANCGNRYGKMDHKGLSFTADKTKFIYAVDATGTRKIKTLFTDLWKDFSLDVFASQIRKQPVKKVKRMAESVTYWTSIAGIQNWCVGDIHISQSKSGHIRVTREDSNYFLRTKPKSGSVFVVTPCFRATASMGKKPIIVVRQADKQFVGDGSTFIARNADHEAVLTEENKLRINF